MKVIVVGIGIITITEELARNWLEELKKNNTGYSIAEQRNREQLIKQLEVWL